MVVQICSQSMIDRFRMSQSTMNLARQDSGEVSNKAENVKRTKIQKRLKIGQHKFWPIFGLKVLLRKCKMFLGQGIHCLTKALFCAYLQNNLHKWTQIIATLLSSQKSQCALNCKISNWCDSILPSGPNNGSALLQQWKSGRCAFMAFASFCGFAVNYFHLSNISVASFNSLHLSNSSFSLFRFLSQENLSHENLYISAGTKEEIVRTKVENKLQWVHLSFILETSFVLIIIQQHDSASVLFLSLSRACNLPSHVFRQLARPIQVREGQR